MLVVTGKKYLPAAFRDLFYLLWGRDVYLMIEWNGILNIPNANFPPN